MECTCDVILRLVRAVVVSEERQQVLLVLSVCVSSLSYPGRRAHAPCHL
jgi:hypothetical protein